MKAIDISSYQTGTNFAKVKANDVEVIYIKATQGTYYTNPLLKEQYQGAKANGMKIGFYHYITDEDPISQAKYFLEAIDLMDADCKYAIDVEDEKISITDASRITRDFADYLILKGKEPCIYTGDYYYRDNLNDTVKDLPLWVARYDGVLMANCYVGYQYSRTGRMEGINGDVDMDKFDNGILLKVTEPKCEDVKKVKNIVAVGNSIDKRAAEYLMDALQCPIIDANMPFDYSVFDNVYCVGATPTTNGKLGWTSYATKIINGTSDRYDTAQVVLDFIKTI